MAALPAFWNRLENLRQWGDRVTGGGLRALGRRTQARTEAHFGRFLLDHGKVAATLRQGMRPVPPLARYLERLRGTSGAAVLPDFAPVTLARRSQPSELAALAGRLPATARPIFARLLEKADRRRERR